MRTPPPARRVAYRLGALALVAWGTSACAGVWGFDSLHLAGDGGSDAGSDGAIADGREAEVGDTRMQDAKPKVEAGGDAEAGAGACDEGLNASYLPSGCRTSASGWLASPYRPRRDIRVDQIQIHTTSGAVAILDSGPGPGTLLFEATVGTSKSPVWLAVDVSPPLSLTGGNLYYLAFQGADCSQASGGPPVTEYASSSLAGPWMVTGTGAWLARVIGTCL
jgi:hypothetical protein